MKILIDQTFLSANLSARMPCARVAELIELKKGGHPRIAAYGCCSRSRSSGSTTSNRT